MRKDPVIGFGYLASQFTINLLSTVLGLECTGLRSMMKPVMNVYSRCIGMSPNVGHKLHIYEVAVSLTNRPHHTNGSSVRRRISWWLSVIDWSDVQWRQPEPIKIYPNACWTQVIEWRMQQYVLQRTTTLDDVLTFSFRASARRFHT